MPLLEEFPVSLSALELLASCRGSRSRETPSHLMRAAEEAVRLARRMARPAAVYREMAVESVRDGVATVWDDDLRAVLHIGERADLLTPARRLIVAAYTIGPELENRAREISLSGDHLLGFLLDSAGVIILGSVGEAVRAIAERRAQETGWRVGPALSPGSLPGWPVEGQREMCDLLPLEEIGVRLNPYHALEPQKSATVVIGWGPDYGEHVGSICRFCSLAARCWRRRDG